MAFFDDIGRKLSATSQTMVNKAKGAADRIKSTNI